MHRSAASTQLRPLTGLSLPVQRQTPRLARRGSAVSVRAEDGQEKKGGFFGFGSKAIKSGTQIIRRDNGKPGTVQKNAGTMVKRAGKAAGPDPSTVFVAGATGRLGARIVRELLASGFKVRAGVRNAQKAESFLDIASSYGLLSKEELSRLQVVKCDLEDADTIAPAIGGAGKVVCAVGAAEAEFSDLSAPRRIDGEGATRLVQAATAAGVGQFILVTSLGTGKLGFPAGVLNVFGGVLIFKRKAEEALEASGLPYVIVRPGGMERPRDDYKLTNNVRLATRDKLFGGQVSRLQVAELVAAAVANPELAENKVLEVVAETAAPAKSYEELLAAHPQELTQEEREAAREAAMELAAAVESAQEQVSSAESRLADIRDTIKAVTAKVGSLRQQEQAVRKENADVLKQAERAEKEVVALRADAEKKVLLASAARAVVGAAQQAQREGRLLDAREVDTIRQNILNPPKVEEAPKAAPAPAARGRGGMFGTKRVRVVEEQPAEEEVEETPAPEPARKGGAFGGLFGGLLKTAAAVAEEEPQQEEEQEQEEQAAAPAPVASKPKPALGFFGIGKKPEAAAPVKEEEKAEPEAAPVPQPKKQQPAVDKRENDQARAAEAAAAAAAAKEAAAKKAADDKAAAEASARRAAEEEERRRKAEEEEAELRERRAEAAAKRRAEDEAIAARVAAEAAAKKAEEEEARRAAAKRAAEQAAAKEAAEREAAKRAAAAAAEAALAAQAARAEPPANVLEAREWIAAWRARSTKPQAATQEQPADDGSVPPNVADARKWISAWKQRSKN